VFIVIIQLRGKITIPFASQLTLGRCISLRLAVTIICLPVHSNLLRR
jgi:hypothetical protein